MYLENFFSNKLKTKSLKKKLVIEQRIKAPIEIDKTEIKVPIHFPNKIPEISKRGDPNPNKDTQIKQKKKNMKRFV